MITFSIINILQGCVLGNTIKDLDAKRGGFGAVMLFGVALQILASIFLWITAAKDPATIPSRVSLAGKLTGSDHGSLQMSCSEFVGKVLTKYRNHPVSKISSLIYCFLLI